MEIPNFFLFTCIGKACGGFANVYISRRRNETRAVAMRVCPLEKLESSYDALKAEVNLLRCLRHPNIISWEEIFIHNSNLCMVSPLMDFGSVTDLIHARFMFGLTEAAIVVILHDVLKAISYLHSRDFIHRGIRCSHVLVSSEGHARLTGFRNATSIIRDGRRNSYLHEFSPDFKSNLLWLAPEVLQQNLAGYGLKSDIYSLGIAACEMANGFPPFSDMAHMQMLLEKLRGTTPRLLDASTLIDDVMEPEQSGVAAEQKDRRFSQHFHSFTETCLKANPVERHGATELLSHAFFKQLKRQRLSLSEILYPVRPLALPKDAGSTEGINQNVSLTTPGEQPGANSSEWIFDE